MLLVLGAMSLPARPTRLRGVPPAAPRSRRPGRRPAQPAGRPAARPRGLDLQPATAGRRALHPAPAGGPGARVRQPDEPAVVRSRPADSDADRRLEGLPVGRPGPDGAAEPCDVRGQLDRPRVRVAAVRHLGPQSQQPADRAVVARGRLAQQPSRLPLRRPARDRLAAAGSQRAGDPAARRRRAGVERPLDTREAGRPSPAAAGDPGGDRRRPCLEGGPVRVGILDILALPSQGPAETLYHALLTKQFASITPQAISVWCRRLGHDTFYAVYYGAGDAHRLLPPDLDVLFVSCYTQVSPIAYAVGLLYREAGTRTVIGGPHAKAFPTDCLRFFDVVVKDCDQELDRRHPGRAGRPGLGDLQRPAVRRRPDGRGADAGDPDLGLLLGAPAVAAVDRADAREHRLPVPVRLLHRLGQPLPAAAHRPARGRPALSRRSAAGDPHRLPRPQLRGEVRRGLRRAGERAGAGAAALHDRDLADDPAGATDCPG